MNIIYFDEIDSTNLYAKRLLETLPDRTLIHAGRQTSGYGQFEREWADLGVGNLFMSLVLKPPANFDKTGLTTYMAEVLCSVLKDYGVKAQVKLPNDVLVNGRKIAGILAETSTKGKASKGVVLGAGVNLNAAETDLLKVDKEITSLNLEIGMPVERDVFLNKLLEKFFSGYDKIIS
ncbi:MAG: biotin--[acetyl-CoA-carboxylase] ligase [Heliobacteriaceae bacterium]|jgi:BirA family biotin operon repressor/biotin-[acetyl-CoA-carboxylase] ligase|nr:biotin--[acetyl-CoA-carboxylase] ligase [Heliobacteriaceae bacterium]